jgi:hypothetical protein
MEQQSREVNVDWLQQTQNVGGLLTMDIGPRGGGKTTKAIWLSGFYQEFQSYVRRISNVPIEGAYYQPNIMKFLATKLIAEGAEKPYEISHDGTVHILPRKTVPARMLVIVDETAISGLEARGSGSYTLNTYLLALSRKLNVDCELISQLMSMADKRAQWLSDFYCLCERFPEEFRFRYRYYDAEFRRTQTYYLSFRDAQDYLFPKFDTTDIPNYDELSVAYRAGYNITDEDMAEYEAIKRGENYVRKEEPIEQHEEQILATKAFRTPFGRYPGETILYNGKRWEVLQRDYYTERKQYLYRLREIPQITIHQAAMDEAGMEPIEDETPN